VISLGASQTAELRGYNPKSYPLEVTVTAKDIYGNQVLSLEKLVPGGQPFEADVTNSAPTVSQLLFRVESKQTRGSVRTNPPSQLPFSIDVLNPYVTGGDRRHASTYVSADGDTAARAIFVEGGQSLRFSVFNTGRSDVSTTLIVREYDEDIAEWFETLAKAEKAHVGSGFIVSTLPLTNSALLSVELEFASDSDTEDARMSVTTEVVEPDGQTRAHGHLDYLKKVGDPAT
jgi:hypothetical protein